MEWKLLLLIALSCALPSGHVCEVECDVIELNRVIELDSDPVAIKTRFSQVIFWDLYSEDHMYHVVAYKCCDLNKVLITKSDGKYVALLFFRMGDRATMVKVVSSALSRTQTFHDPEVRDQSILPTRQRKGFRCEHHERSERELSPPAPH